MADYNYGLLTNMASGIREGMNTYLTMKNQQRQESMLENQIKNQEQDRKMKMLTSGITEDQSGGLILTPEAEQKKKAEAGLVQEKIDTMEREKGRHVPGSPGAIALAKLLEEHTGKKVPEGMTEAQLEKTYGLIGGIYKSDKAGERINLKIDGQEDWRDRQTHTGVVKRASSDRILLDRLKQVNNLDNAVAAFGSGTATPQQFEELQQAVRANMGIKGSSGVHEREATKLKSLGQQGAAALQFLTSKPQDINEFIDPSMVKHVLELVESEKKNIRRQADLRMKAISAGQGNLYNRRPDLKADLDEALAAQLEQFEGSQNPNIGKADYATPKESPGMISKIMGSVGLGKANAAGDNVKSTGPQGDIVEQGGKKFKWNAVTNKYEKM